MRRCTRSPHPIIRLGGTLLTLVVDTLRSISLCLGSPTSLAAENLFLRRQLALSRERGIKPRRATHASRIALTVLARWFDWRQALVIVQPATLIRWHRQGSRDRDSIFSARLDQQVRNLRLRVFKSRGGAPRQTSSASGCWARCGGNAWTA